MHYVYFIQSLKDDSVYIGSTADLRKRFREHNSGQSTYTKSRMPYRLIYYEAYTNKKTALIRENELKRSWNQREAVMNRFKV